MDTNNKTRIKLSSLRELTKQQIETLAAEQKLTVEAFQKQNAAWETDKDILLAIIDPPEAVGMISLGGLHCSMPAIGYWIIKSRRGEGIMREAFFQALLEVKCRGKQGVVGRIHKDNTASLKIFQRHSAEFREINGTETFFVTLRFSKHNVTTQKQEI